MPTPWPIFSKLHWGKTHQKPEGLAFHSTPVNFQLAGVFTFKQPID
jgi:hypothetical protein